MRVPGQSVCFASSGSQYDLKRHGTNCLLVFLTRKCLSCPIWTTYISPWWHPPWKIQPHLSILQTISHQSSRPWSPRTTCPSSALRWGPDDRWLSQNPEHQTSWCNQDIAAWQSPPELCVTAETASPAGKIMKLHLWWQKAVKYLLPLLTKRCGMPEQKQCNNNVMFYECDCDYQHLQESYVVSCYWFFCWLRSLTDWN